MPDKGLGSESLRLVIIGSGIAGHSACRSVREASDAIEVVMITRETIPLYSPCVLPLYLAGKIQRDRVFLPMGCYGTAGERVSLMTDTNAVEIDLKQKVVLLDRGTLSYDRLILALGGYSVVPPLEGINLPGVFLFKTLNDVDKVMEWPVKRAVVVGSGPIGLEVAAALSERGIRVCLIELVDQLLPAILDDGPAKIVQNIFVEAGIEISVGEEVRGLTGQGHVEAVVTNKRTVPADLVVFAVGIRPAIDIAKNTGLSIGRAGGIMTDGFLATSDPHIWACGDCIESCDIISGLPALNMLWPNALVQGSIAGINAAGGKMIYGGSFPFVTVNVFETFIFSFGSTSQSLPGCTVKEKESRRGYIRTLTKEGRLVGVQIIGDDSWAGVITSAILNQDRAAYLKADLVKKHLIYRISQSHKLMKLVGDLVN